MSEPLCPVICCSWNPLFYPEPIFCLMAGQTTHVFSRITSKENTTSNEIRMRMSLLLNCKKRDSASIMRWDRISFDFVDEQTDKKLNESPFYPPHLPISGHFAIPFPPCLTAIDMKKRQPLVEFGYEARIPRMRLP